MVCGLGGKSCSGRRWGGLARGRDQGQKLEDGGSGRRNHRARGEQRTSTVTQAALGVVRPELRLFPRRVRWRSRTYSNPSMTAGVCASWQVVKRAVDNRGVVLLRCAVQSADLALVERVAGIMGQTVRALALPVRASGYEEAIA